MSGKECKLLTTLLRLRGGTPDELNGRASTRGIRRGETERLLRGLERKRLVMSSTTTNWTSPENLRRTAIGRAPRRTTSYTLTARGREKAVELRRRGCAELD